MAIRDTFEAYESFAKKLAVSCGLDPREFQLPMMVRSLSMIVAYIRFNIFLNYHGNETSFSKTSKSRLVIKKSLVESQT